MACCSQGEFNFLENGFQVKERLVQEDGYAMRFISYRAIQSVELTYSRQSKENILGVYLRSGMNYQWSFSCEPAGLDVYERIIARVH